MEAKHEPIPRWTSDLIISVKPAFAWRIVKGEKTVELRRRFAKNSVIGGRILIYASSPDRAIIGAGLIADIEHLNVDQLWKQHGDSAVISRSAFLRYFSGVSHGVAVSIRAVVCFEQPLPVSELRERFSFTPPQSYCYVYGRLEELLNDERIQISHRYKYSHRPRR